MMNRHWLRTAASIFVMVSLVKYLYSFPQYIFGMKSVPVSNGVHRVVPSQADVPLMFRVPPLNSVDLYEITIPALQQQFEMEKLTSEDYTRFCIERIHAIDPYLESVIELNPDALDIAASLDKERASGKVRGALHGIPVMVKDNIATKDKMQTTAGSWALMGSVVPRDAFIVSSLRKAGAIILGHAGMTEWASLRSRDYSDGYSPRRGQVRNPFDLWRSPFGSSGGSAVVVSANIVPLSIGTETDGSIAGPAMANGIVGIKPTVGLVSRSGVIPSSESMDTVGTFGRTVLDAVIGLNAIAGADEIDSATLNPSCKRSKDYSEFLANKAVLKGARFGLPINRCWEFVAEDQKKAATRILDAITEAGGLIIHVDYPCAEDRIPSNGKWDWEHGEPSKSEFTVVKVEAYNGINQYLSELTNTPIKCFEDIVKFNIENSGTEGASPGDHPAFPTGQDIFNDIATAKGEKSQIYYEALKYIRHKTREEGIDAALRYKNVQGETIHLDALILSDKRLVGQQIAAQAGYPTITLPIGVDDRNLPVGITLQHTAWEEGKLIKWASAIEDLRNEVFGGRPLPAYKNHLAKNVPIGGNFEA